MLPQQGQQMSRPADPNTQYIRLQPKQAELHGLVEHGQATWLGYGGSRGGAKSGGGRRVVLSAAIRQPNTTFCILRRTYKAVKENHIDKILAEYPILRDGYRVGDSEILLPNKSKIAFRYAENTGDVEAMIGSEYAIFMVDQAEQFNEHELVTMKSCARWPGLPPERCKFILTFNPGNVGHAFLQRIFYDRKFWTMDGRLITEKESDKQGSIEWKEIPSQYAFIQAYGWDNVEWGRSVLESQGLTENDFYSWDADKRFDFYIHQTQFGREQNALPQALRIGWLLGHMDQFAGQYYDIFSRERHVSPCQPESWHTRTIGIDWGFDHDSVAEWTSQIKPDMLAVYREFSGSGRSCKALAQEIVDRTPPEERPLVQHIYLSHDAFSERDERDSNASQMSDVFKRNGMLGCSRATTDVPGRASLLYDLLRENQIIIDPRCPKLIETIPIACIDTKRPLDKRESRAQLRPMKFAGDDALDAFWYSTTGRLASEPKPHELVVREAAAEISDEFTRWWYLKKNLPQRKQARYAPQYGSDWQKQAALGS